jgi:8-oxo-dGTP pyrophosphatase MutT (NUDIX family)
MTPHPFLSHIQAVNTYDPTLFLPIDIAARTMRVHRTIIGLGMEYVLPKLIGDRATFRHKKLIDVGLEQDAAIDVTRRGIKKEHGYIVLAPHQKSFIFLHDNTPENLGENTDKFGILIKEHEKTLGITLEKFGERLPIHGWKPGNNRKEYTWLVDREIAPLLGLPTDSVKALLYFIDEHGEKRFLMGKTQAGSHPGRWDTPGGGWPYNIPTAVGAALKEALEECSLEETNIIGAPKIYKSIKTASTCYKGLGLKLNTAHPVGIRVDASFQPLNTNELGDFVTFSADELLLEMARNPKSFKPSTYITLVHCFMEDGIIQVWDGHKKPISELDKIKYVSPETWVGLHTQLNNFPPGIQSVHDKEIPFPDGRPVLKHPDERPVLRHPKTNAGKSARAP